MPSDPVTPGATAEPERARTSICRTRNLAATRGGRTVVSGIELDLTPGSITVVRGPNGSGKSTLLEVLALLRRPSAGSLHLFGETAAVNNLALRRRVTLLTQPTLFFRGTAVHNVAYGLRARGIGRPEASSRSLDALDRVGASHLASRPAAALSAGERQRVGLARAIVLATPLLLLDEPNANLDDAGATLVHDLLAQWSAQNEIAIVVSTPGDETLTGLANTLIDLDGSR